MSGHPKGSLQKKKKTSVSGGPKRPGGPRPNRALKKKPANNSKKSNGSIFSCCSKKSEKSKKKVAHPPAKKSLQHKPKSKTSVPVKTSARMPPVVAQHPMRSAEPTKEDKSARNLNIPPPGHTKELIVEGTEKTEEGKPKRSDEKINKKEKKETQEVLQTAEYLDETETSSKSKKKKKKSKEKTKSKEKVKEEESESEKRVVKSREPVPLTPDDIVPQQSLFIKKFVRDGRSVFRWEYEETEPLGKAPSHRKAASPLQKKEESSDFCCNCCICVGDEKGSFL